MVWKERSKYGVHTGRTLRKMPCESDSRDRGFLVKTIITNSGINVSDEEFQRCLQKVQLNDGLDEEAVVEESRFHHRLHTNGGFPIDSLQYSIGKRKRWLLPKMLRDKASKDICSESESKVVLVERVSANSNSWFYQPSRLKHGDCRAVLDGADLRKPKRRKFAHVGDLRKKSDKHEIVYEVNHTETGTSWPCYLQRDFREFRDVMKSRLKAKGKKNKRRLWGEYRKSDLSKMAFQSSWSDGKTQASVGKKKEMLLNKNNFDRFEVEENDSVLTKFDLGSFICKSLHSIPDKQQKKHVREDPHDKEKLTIVNPASSQRAKLYGKGSAMHVDISPEYCFHDNPDETFSTNPSVNVHLTSSASVPGRVVSQTVDLESQNLDSQKLQEKFGELYMIGGSLPRRFSICSENYDNKFVFTFQNCSKDGQKRVMVTAISDELPVKKSQILRQFLLKHFSVASMQEGFKEPSNDCFHDGSPNARNEHFKTVAKMPFDLLYDVNQWSCKTCSPQLAVPRGLSSNETCCNESGGDLENDGIPEIVTCEICCCEFYNGPPDAFLPCTALIACMHWFCDDCWKSYLSAEIHQGKTAISCPSYNCNTSVDDVTMMSLLPGSFPKFERLRQEKALEMDAKWKWCPGNKCNLVVMATASGAKAESAPIPVYCDCGLNWCFACQEEPHWPATCARAAFFRSQTESYEKVLRTKAGAITSVSVKRCPHCNYPIEKNKGCPHMTCGMCYGQFCWECLGNWLTHDWSADCSKRSKKEEEVELVNHIGSTRFNLHLRAAMANRMERATPAMYQKYSEVKNLEGVLQVLDVVSKCRNSHGKNSSSATAVLLQQYKSYSVPECLKASADFKFQTHFVIEGLSILMAVSKTKQGHSELKKRVATLQFVLERLENIANSRKLCSESDKLRFERLLNAGKNCISSVRKLCVKVNKTS